MDSCKNKSNLIKAEALRLGFSDCGIAKAHRLQNDEVHLKNWLMNGHHADMEYMSVNFDKRCNPTVLVKNAKSVVSVIINYFPKVLQNEKMFRISKYAYGNDYHEILKQRLYKLLDFINSNFSITNARVFTDTAPILERAWAFQAGLGWIGKNTCLITKKFGSWVFIGELMIDVDLYEDEPQKSHCGSCTKCMDACPTKAIVAPYVVDSNKCISYHTIENKNAIPNFLKGKMNNYYFGCDICQDVCMWNKKPTPTDDAEMQFTNPLLTLSPDELFKLDEKEIQLIIAKTSLKRSKAKKIKRNLEFLK